MEHLRGGAHVLQALADAPLGGRQRVRLEERLDLVRLLRSAEVAGAVDDHRCHQRRRGLREFLFDEFKVLKQQQKVQTPLLVLSMIAAA